jgi:enoyl-CoA hydratase/carnithine racemase
VVTVKDKIKKRKGAGMKMINVENRDSVALVKLSREVTNALNLELIEELSEHIRTAANDPGVHGLVLASRNEKFFSIGWDIPQLYELQREEFAVFYRAFNRTCLDLYTMPKPSAAAITGHATAGGCILALCCDYRFIAEGKKLMGLNEIKLGVPVPYLADRLLVSIVGVQNAREIMESGDFYLPEQSLQMGMVDQVLPMEEVLTKSMEKAKLLGSFPQQAFAGIKRNRVESLEAQDLKCGKEKERSFIDCWYSGPARKRLKEAMETFKKKKG